MSTARMQAALLFVLGLCVGCGGGPPAQFSPQRVDLSQARVEIPMQIIAGLPVITARTSHGPVTLVIDTATDGGMLTQFAATRNQIALHSTDHVSYDGFGRSHPLAGMGHFDQLLLGTANFQNFDVGVFPADEPPAQAMKADADGVLGLGAFKDLLVTLDFVNHKLILERGALPPANGRTVVDTRIGPMGKLMVPVDIRNDEIWCQLATGQSAALLIPRNYAMLFPGAMQATRVEALARYGLNIGVGRLSSDLMIGGHTLDRPVAIVGIGYEPTIGTGCLQYFSITIDQQNGRIRLNRTSKAPIHIEPSKENSTVVLAD